MSRTKDYHHSALTSSRKYPALWIRTVVDTAADLVFREATWQAPDGTLYVYKGMLVSVVNDLTEINGVYRLAALPVTSEISWVKASGRWKREPYLLVSG